MSLVLLKFILWNNDYKAVSPLKKFNILNALRLTVIFSIVFFSGEKKLCFSEDAFLLHNVLTIDPLRGLETNKNVLIVGGKILDIYGALEDKGTGVHNKMQLRIIDATGLFLIPVLSLHLELVLLIQSG